MLALDNLLSLLQKIAYQPPMDSKLYGCAIAAKAFSTLFNECDFDQKFELYRAIGDQFYGTFDDIKNRFKTRKKEWAKVFSNKIDELHKNRDLDFPHLDIYFTLLLSETFDSVSKKNVDATFYNIYIAKELTAMINLSERHGINKALDYLNGKDALLKNVFSDLTQVIDKYTKESIENHFNNLLKEFDSYDFNGQTLRLMAKGLLGKEMYELRVTKKVRYLISEKWEKNKAISFRLGSCLITGPNSSMILCNLWPLFMGSIWKNIMTHEVFHAIFLPAIPFRTKSFVKNPKNSGFMELYHGLIHFLTLQEIKKDPILRSYYNILLGMAPFGCVLSIAWYHAMEKKWPGITFAIPEALKETCISGNLNEKVLKEKCITGNLNELFVSVLNTSFEKIGQGTRLAVEDIPNVLIFCSQSMLTNGLLNDPNDVRLRDAGVIRCVLKVLLYLDYSVSAEQMYEFLKDKNVVKTLKLFLYMPREAYNREEVYQAFEVLLKMSVLEEKDKKYKLII